MPQDGQPASRPWWRVLVSIVLCVLVLSAGGFAFVGLASLRKPPEERSTTEKVYNVEVFEVAREDLREVVSAFGTATADREVIVAAQVSGEVIELHPQLRVGRDVRGLAVEAGPDGRSVRRNGDLLVRIDSTPYRERVAEVRAQLAADDAELARLKQEQTGNARMLAMGEQDIDVFREEYDRISKLSERGVAAKSQLTDALLQLKKYQQALINYENERDLFPVRREQVNRRKAAHEAQLEQARHDLARTEVRAPFDGRLSEVHVDLGQYVRAGDPLVRITDLRVVDVPVPVPLRDYAYFAARLAAGESPQCVLAENESASARWTGTVVRAAPEADESTRTVRLFVQVNNAEQRTPLLPGTFVHVRIDGPVHRATVAAPRDALLEGRMFVVRDGRATEIRPRPRQLLQSLALFDTGLEAGERLILTNLDVIHEGAAVQVERIHVLEDELQRHLRPTVRRQAAENRQPAPRESLAPPAANVPAATTRRIPQNLPPSPDSGALRRIQQAAAGESP